MNQKFKDNFREYVIEITSSDKEFNSKMNEPCYPDLTQMSGRNVEGRLEPSSASSVERISVPNLRQRRRRRMENLPRSRKAGVNHCDEQGICIGRASINSCQWIALAAIAFALVVVLLFYIDKWYFTFPCYYSRAIKMNSDILVPSADSSEEILPTPTTH